jgi:hypothetical protein
MNNLGLKISYSGFCSSNEHIRFESFGACLHSIQDWVRNLMGKCFWNLIMPIPKTLVLTKDVLRADGIVHLGNCFSDRGDKNYEFSLTAIGRHESVCLK